MSAHAKTDIAFAFCSGKGQYDARGFKLSDGRQNLSPLAGHPYDGVTEADIEAMVRQPPQVEKAVGQWFIPSIYLAFDGRSHDMQRARGRFFWLPLDVDSGNLSLDQVDDVAKRVLGDVRRFVYSTRSSEPDNRKWRVLVPLADPVPGADYADTVAAFYDLLLMRSDGRLRADRALCRAGQLVYLPNRGAFYEHRVVEGPTCALSDTHVVIKRRDQTRQKLAAAETEAKAERARRAEMRPAGERSIVADFNARNPIGEMLAQYGYAQSGSDWRSPNQKGGSYATRERGDHWISLSTSDGEEGLGVRTKNGNRTGDAFDLFVHYEHDGDFGAAVRAHMEVMAGLGVGRVNPADEFSQEDSDIGRSDEGEEGLRIYSAASLAGRPVPARRALDKTHMLPMETVIGLGGDGAVGKSLLAMQLGCGVALTGRWIGIEVARGPVVYFSSEDDRDENNIRLSEIAKAEGFALEALTDLHILDMVGKDAVLAAEDARKGRMQETPLLEKIRRVLARLRPVLLVLDNLADVFSGNESNRVLARQFVGLLRGLAKEFSCTVILLYHPSLSGMASGVGSSGSTGWNNSYRSRLYMYRELDDKGVERNIRRRVLEHKKANYAGSGSVLRLEWEAGRYTPLDGLNELDGTFDAEAHTRRVERVFLELVDWHRAQGMNVSNSTGPNYAPVVFAGHPDAEGISNRDFRTAMVALLNRGEITMLRWGTDARPRQTIVRGIEGML